MRSADQKVQLKHIAGYYYHIQGQLDVTVDRWYIHCYRIINGAAWGLMKALTEGWQLCNGTWDTKILEMVAFNQNRWYDVVDILSALPVLELPDL